MEDSDVAATIIGECSGERAVALSDLDLCETEGEYVFSRAKDFGDKLIVAWYGAGTGYGLTPESDYAGGGAGVIVNVCE